MSEEIQDQIDEINNKLETVAQILYAIRTQWATVIPEPPAPEAEKEPDSGLQ